MHADFLRVVADHKLTASTSLHQRRSWPLAIKQSGGEISTISKSSFPACRKTCRNSSKSTWPSSCDRRYRSLWDLKAPGASKLAWQPAATITSVANIHASRVVKEEGSEEGAADEVLAARSPFHEGLPS